MVSSDKHERYPGMNEYAKDAMRTSAETGTTEAELAVCGLGLTGEAGEVADSIKKILFHGHPLDDDAIAKIAKELGDVLWYVARCSLAIGTTLDDVAAGNVDKLARRYPDGFSSKASMDRPEYSREAINEEFRRLRNATFEFDVEYVGGVRVRDTNRGEG